MDLEFKVVMGLALIFKLSARTSNCNEEERAHGAAATNQGVDVSNLGWLN
jgi:hypothetical protein